MTTLTGLSVVVLSVLFGLYLLLVLWLAKSLLRSLVALLKGRGLSD